MIIHPPSQTVVVRLSCWPSPASEPLFDLTLSAARAIVAALGDSAS